MKAMMLGVVSLWCTVLATLGCLGTTLRLEIILSMSVMEYCSMA